MGDLSRHGMGVQQNADTGTMKQVAAAATASSFGCIGTPRAWLAGPEGGGGTGAGGVRAMRGSGDGGQAFAGANTGVRATKVGRDVYGGARAPIQRNERPQPSRCIVLASPGHSGLVQMAVEREPGASELREVVGMGDGRLMEYGCQYSIASSWSHLVVLHWHP